VIYENVRVALWVVRFEVMATDSLQQQTGPIGNTVDDQLDAQNAHLPNMGNENPGAASVSEFLRELTGTLFAKACEAHGIDPNSLDAKVRVSRLMKAPARSKKLRAFKDTL
jgi:hypothetical protein